MSDAPPANSRRAVDVLLRSWMELPSLVRALAPICVMGLLWWSSAQEQPPTPRGLLRPALHNGLHAVAYAVLAAAAWLAMPASSTPRQRSVSCFVLACVYGVVDELHQSYVPGRVCSVADVLTDACGAGLAQAWLRARFARDVVRGRIQWWLLACLLSALLATWGPF